MDTVTHFWRPEERIRALAIGLPFRDGRMLVSAVSNDNGDVKGWRPLGGGVDFGETAEAAVIRELHEELQAEAVVERQLGVFENIFTHQGVRGHEVVFAFEVTLTDPGIAAADAFIIEDSGFRDRAAWLPVEDFFSGAQTLLPSALLPLVPTDRGA